MNRMYAGFLASFSSINNFLFTFLVGFLLVFIIPATIVTTLVEMLTRKEWYEYLEHNWFKSFHKNLYK
jgi:hypothetical protein